jgi:hypothetical protein
MIKWGKSEEIKKEAFDILKKDFSKENLLSILE